MKLTWNRMNTLSGPALACLALLCLSCNSSLQEASAGLGLVSGEVLLSHSMNADDFGAAVTGSGSSTREITLTNSGEMSLRLVTLPESGSGTAFAIAAGGSCTAGLEISPTATCTVRFTFTPAGNGTVSENLDITYEQVLADGLKNDPNDRKTLRIPLVGRGVPGSESTSDVTISAATEGLGSRVINHESTTTVITLKNNSATQDFYLSGVKHDTSGHFSISGNQCPTGETVLAAGTECQLTVTFAPTATGSYQYKVSFDYGITGGSPDFTALVTLSGSGILASTIGNAAITFSPDTASFGSVSASATTAGSSKTFTLTNTARLPVYISSLAESHVSYAITSEDCPDAPAALAAGATCTATVKFAPANGGTAATSLKATYGVISGTYPFTSSVEMTGTGVADLSFSGISSISTTTTSATLNWTHVTGAVVYYIYSVSSAGIATQIGYAAAPTATYTVSSLTPSTTYKYRVRAANSLYITDLNTNDVTATTSDLGSFAAITAFSVAEGVTGSSATLGCTDGVNTPTYTVTSQTDSTGGCTISGSKVQCTPAYASGHSSRTNTVVVSCALNGYTYTQSATVTITDTNRAPVLSSQTARTVSAGSAITAADLSDTSGGDTDTDGDTLTYSCTVLGDSNSAFTTATACGSSGAPVINSSTGALTWTTASGQASSSETYTITITASDGQASPLTGSTTLTVHMIPSVITAFSVAEAATGTSATLSCSDGTNTPSYAISSQSDTTANCSIASSKVSCTPSYASGHATRVSNVVVACTLGGTVYNQSVAVSITDTNRAPSLSSLTAQNLQALNAITAANAQDSSGGDTDSDGDALSYSCTIIGDSNSYFTTSKACGTTGAPTIVASTGVVSWTTLSTHASSTNETYTITITASDQQGTPLTGTTTLSVTVTPATPILTTVTQPVFQAGVSGTFDLNNIRDGSPGSDASMTYACTFTSTAQTTATNCNSLPGTPATKFVTTTGVLTWTPTDASTSIDAYTLTITGTNAAGTDTATVIVPVTPNITTTNLESRYMTRFGTLKAVPASGVTSWLDLKKTNNGTLSGTALNTGWTSTSPYYLTFPGTDEHVNMGSNLLAGKTRIFVNFWMSPTDSSLTGTQILTNGGHTGNGISLTQSTNAGKLLYKIANTASCESTNTLTSGYWYHVSLSYDQTDMKMYINGQQQCSTTTAANILPSENLNIGAKNDGTSPWKGKISQLEFYSTSDSSVPLSTTQMQTNLTKTIHPFITLPSALTVTPTVWYDADDSSTLFSDAAMTTAVASGSDIKAWKDKSGNNNHLYHYNNANLPTYTASQLNGRGSVYCSDDRLYDSSGAVTLREIYVVMVNKSASGGIKNIISNGSDQSNIRFNDQNGLRGNGQNSEDNGDFTKSGGSMKLNSVTGQTMANDTITILEALAPSDKSLDKFTLCNWKYNGSGRGFVGYIYEVLGFGSALGAADKKALYEYLQKRWGATF